MLPTSPTLTTLDTLTHPAPTLPTRAALSPPFDRDAPRGLYFGTAEGAEAAGDARGLLLAIDRAGDVVALVVIARDAPRFGLAYTRLGRLLGELDPLSA